MSDLQSLSTYPVGSQSPTGIEEITIKAKKTNSDGFTFWDFLDVINPLQHIPVVNAIYREMTGDEINTPVKMIGGAIIGGPIGLALAMVDSAVEDAPGKDMGSHAMAMFQRDETELPVINPVTPAVVADATAAVISATAREFIPAALTAVSSAQLLTPNVLDEEDEEENAAPPQEETEAAIAATAAAAPQDMVSMPLPGRGKSTSLSGATSKDRAQEFMPLKPTDRSSAARPVAARELDQAELAQLQAQSVFPSGVMGQSSRLEPCLEATKPLGDSGVMPPADPFAAEWLVADESGAVMLPAWFDRTMIDALDKYRTMQAVGDGKTAR
jgi:hypothetical protein